MATYVTGSRRNLIVGLGWMFNFLLTQSSDFVYLYNAKQKLPGYTKKPSRKHQLVLVQVFS